MRTLYSPAVLTEEIGDTQALITVMDDLVINQILAQDTAELPPTFRVNCESPKQPGSSPDRLALSRLRRDDGVRDFRGTALDCSSLVEANSHLSRY